MRKKHPRKGDKRVKEKFLLFPKTVEFETRWLERARWEDEYQIYLTNVGIHGEWKAMKWLT